MRFFNLLQDHCDVCRLPCQPPIPVSLPLYQRVMARRRTYDWSKSGFHMHSGIRHLTTKRRGSKRQAGCLCYCVRSFYPCHLFSFKLYTSGRHVFSRKNRSAPEICVRWQKNQDLNVNHTNAPTILSHRDGQLCSSVNGSSFSRKNLEGTTGSSISLKHCSPSACAAKRSIVAHGRMLTLHASLHWHHFQLYQASDVRTQSNNALKAIRNRTSLPQKSTIWEEIP